MKLNLAEPKERQQVLSRLCGEEMPLSCLLATEEKPSCGSCPRCVAAAQLGRLKEPWAVGHLNQALLFGGQPPVSEDFYNAFFIEAASDAELLEGIVQFRAYAMLAFGNFRFAFRRLAQLTREGIERELGDYALGPAQWSERYEARPHGTTLVTTKDLGREKRWYLGYVSSRLLTRDQSMLEALRLRHRKAALPGDASQVLTDLYTAVTDEQLAQWPLDRLEETERLLTTSSKERVNAVREGRANTVAYLAAQHIDVYVATSMRESWEYEATVDLLESLFGKKAIPEAKRLQELDVTYFDPTVSDARSRIDKGLVEGLMLRRGRATIYMVQETDTLGKDSELASTLAQGKPVIAYVPSPTHDTLIAELAASPLRRTFKRMLMLASDGLLEGADAFAQLRADFVPTFQLDREEESEFKDAHKDELAKLSHAVAAAEIAALNRRADLLVLTHPLALQLELSSGVAQGILVARTPARCAELLQQVLLNDLPYSIDDVEDRGVPIGTFLNVTGEPTTPYRVVTADPVLSNAFWQLYRFGESHMPGVG
ncbi:MAG TPA: hypothetical protein VEP48_08810 [Methylomirabilota bacterium]|nr:hypothetical protein [Methylomirabilota bacterium]